MAKIEGTAVAQDILKANRHPDYENLPESIKAEISEKEYCWMSETQRLKLEQEMTMPEATDD